MSDTFRFKEAVERVGKLEAAIRKHRECYQAALEKRAPAHEGYEVLDVYPAYDWELWEHVDGLVEAGRAR